MEIERKYLVSQLPDLAHTKQYEIAQTYLSSEIRVRKIADAYVLTIKSSGTLTREETEVPISADSYAALSQLTQHKIRKRRHEFMHNGVCIYIDVFEDGLEGLVLAEIELQNEYQLVSLPPWVGKEVTHDQSYYNAALAQRK